MGKSKPEASWSHRYAVRLKELQRGMTAGDAERLGDLAAQKSEGSLSPEHAATLDTLEVAMDSRGWRKEQHQSPSPLDRRNKPR